MPEKTDQEIVGMAINILASCVELIPYIERFKEISHSPDHDLFKKRDEAMPPELEEHVRVMRMAQAGALAHLVDTIRKTSLTTATQIPEIMNRAAQREAVEGAMKNLGLDDDKGQMSDTVS